MVLKFNSIPIFEANEKRPIIKSHKESDSSLYKLCHFISLDFPLKSINRDNRSNI